MTKNNENYNNDKCNKNKKDKNVCRKKIHNNTIDEIINKNGCSINIDISDDNRVKNNKEGKIENTGDTRKKLKGKKIKKKSCLHK